MLHYVAFHLGLIRLTQYHLKGLSKFGIFKSDYRYVLKLINHYWFIYSNFKMHISVWKLKMFHNQIKNPIMPEYICKILYMHLFKTKKKWDNHRR